jgi:hypothetical protein
MNKESIASEDLGIMLMEFIATLDTPITGVLAALSFVAATIACESGYTKEESMKAFGDVFENAKLRLEMLKTELN